MKEYELLFGLLSECYERASVLVTSNLDFASWTEIFGDASLTSKLSIASPTALTSSSFGATLIAFKESLRQRTMART